MKYSLNNITESFMGKIKKRRDETVIDRATADLSVSINEIKWTCEELGKFIEKRFNAGLPISYGKAKQMSFEFSKQLFIDFQKEYKYFKPYTFNELKYFRNINNIIDYSEDECWLSEVSLPACIISIPKFLFFGFEHIKYVHSSEIESFEPSCFTDCKKLESIAISENVKEFGEYCFEDTGISVMVVPKGGGIKNIPQYFCAKCKNLKTLILSPTIETCGEYAFSDIPINYVTLPPKMTEISDSLFANCKHLKEIDIPENIKKIGEKAFNNCYRLSKVTVHSEIKFTDRPFQKDNLGKMSSIVPDLYVPKELKDYYSIGNKDHNIDAVMEDFGSIHYF